MLLKEAVDEFLLYLEIEKNLSENTVIGYEFIMKHFLMQHDCFLKLSSINKALVRRYIPH